MSSQLAWPAVVLAALVLFCAPVIIAHLRRTERIGLVVLLTMLTLLLPPAWFVALGAPFFLPRRPAPHRGQAVPPHMAARPGGYAAGPPAAYARRARPAAGSRRRI